MAMNTEYIARLFLFMSIVTYASPEDETFDIRHHKYITPIMNSWREFSEESADSFLRMPPTYPPSTTTTQDPLLGEQYEMVRVCRCKNYTSPVCGIYGGKLKTHKNHNCMRLCSPKTRKLHSGPCRVNKGKVNKVDTEYMNAYKPNNDVITCDGQWC